MTLKNLAMKLNNMSQLYAMPDPIFVWLLLKDVLSKSFNKHAQIISKCVKDCFCQRLTVNIKAKLKVKDQLHKNPRKSNTATN